MLFWNLPPGCRAIWPEGPNRCVDGNYKRRPNSNQAPCYVTINQHEARVNKKRPTFVDPHQQCCAISNVSSVWYQLLPWLYLLVSTCTEIHHDVQINRLPLGRGQRGRSLREDVVDNGGDQPILQDETGLTSGTSNERKQPKKCSKTLKSATDPLW